MKTMVMNNERLMICRECREPIKAAEIETVVLASANTWVEAIDIDSLGGQPLGLKRSRPSRTNLHHSLATIVLRECNDWNAQAGFSPGKHIRSLWKPVFYFACRRRRKPLAGGKEVGVDS